MTAKNGSFRFVLKLVVVVGVLAAAGFFAFRNLADTATVYEVRRGKAVDTVTGSVTVTADGGILPLKTEVPGRVIACGALDLEKHFKKGDVLLELDPTDIAREIKTAEHDYTAAAEKAEFTRTSDPKRKLAQEALDNAERLFAKGELAEKDLRATRTALEAIDTALKLADRDAAKAKSDFEAIKARSERILEKMKIVAPFDGMIQTPLTFEGAIVGAGDTVALILKEERVVAAKVSEDSIAKVKVGQAAKLTLLAYPGEQFDATVKKILTTADESQRFGVFLDVKTDPQRLQHGSTGEVRINVNENENQPLIPRRALFNTDYVKVVKNGRVEKRKVEVGFLALNYAEIRKGLEPGELVIVENLDEFYAGQRVRLPAAPTQKN